MVESRFIVNIIINDCRFVTVQNNRFYANILCILRHQIQEVALRPEQKNEKGGGVQKDQTGRPRRPHLTLRWQLPVLAFAHLLKEWLA